MRCPKCQHNKSSVIDSRQAEDGNTIRRRRECDTCHTRFTTFERVEEVPLLVVKKDGTREQFSRDKILENVWDENYFGSDRVVDDTLRRLRKKLPNLNIHTIYGYGYRLG